ncbi:unnamed protein product [Euphydryas editha]|uniref:Odorant receptor n=1 Tax=Euphydryas editha TaxID=104508 RepID=A0AAU9TZH0_EUPED|nr:unnamed protein product [Euphydryas editha]
MLSGVLINVWTKLRKFSLDHDDLPTMIENVALLLRILTINIYNSSESIHLIFYIMTLLSSAVYLYVDIVSMVYCVFFRYGKSDLIAVSVILALSSCSCTCITKLIFMKVYAKDIKKIVNDFLKCDSQVLSNTRFAKNLRKQLKIVKRRASVIWILLVSNGAVYIISPFVTPGRHFSVDLYLLYGLEPMNKTPNYEIANFIITVGTGFGVYAMVSVAVYVIVIVGYNESQLHALSEELKNVWYDSEIFYNNIKHRITEKRHDVNIRKQIMNEFIRIRLRDIIKFHITNINMQHYFDQKFRPMFAVEYTIKAFSIIVGLLGGLKNTYLALPYTFVQIVMDCLTGQRLIDACENFERSLYSCQWENFNTSNQRTILLMLMMSQKTLILSAGGIAKLNFNYMMIILKSAYSTYTTLNSVVKKHN